MSGNTAFMSPPDKQPGEWEDRAQGLLPSSACVLQVEAEPHRRLRVPSSATGQPPRGRVPTLKREDAAEARRLHRAKRRRRAAKIFPNQLRRPAAARCRDRLVADMRAGTARPSSPFESLP